MAADGSIIIDVNLNDNDARRGIRDLNGELGNTRGSEAGINRVSSAIGNIAKVAAVSVAAVAGLAVAGVSLARPFVEAAAAAEAANAQFSAVFGNLETQARQRLNGIAESTNILPDRLQESFTRIAAFARTTGVDTAAALDLTSRATIAAADSAAFYDRSIEETTESLQSFLKGNFENDAALGISATETTRNAAANRLYGRSFIELDEAQKQLTLLNLVEEGNRLSGALGQAAREGTAFENVSGNLRQAVTNLQARIGAFILQPFIDGIVFLTNVLQNVDVDALVASIRSIYDSFLRYLSPLAPLVEELFNVLRDVFGRFGDNVQSEFEGPLSQILPFITSVVNGIRFYIQRTLNIITDLWRDNGDDILNTVIRIYSNLIDIVGPIFVELVDFIRTRLDIIFRFFAVYGNDILTAVTNIFNAVLAVIEFVMPQIQFVVRRAWNLISGIIDAALNVIIGLVKVFTGIFTLNFDTLWSGLRQITRAQIGLIVTLISNSFIGDILRFVSNFVTSFVGFISNLWDRLVNAFNAGVNNVIVVFSGFVNSLVSFVSNLVNTVLNFIVGLWLDITFAFIDGISFVLIQILTFIQDAVFYFEDLRNRSGNIFLNLLDDIINVFVNLFNNAVELVTNLVTSIISFFSNLQQRTLELVLSLVNSVINFFVNLYNTLVNATTNGIQAIINFFVSLRNSVINSVQALRDGAVNLFFSLRDGIVNAVTNLFNNVVSFFTNLRSNIVSTTQNLATEGTNNVRTLATNMINAIKGLPAQFLQYGKDIISGFINGIKSLDPVAAITDIGNGIKNRLTSIFDIHSPSRYIRDEIVGNLAAGATVGVRKYRDELLSAGDGIANNLNAGLINLSPNLTGVTLGSVAAQQATGNVTTDNSRSANYTINVTNDDEGLELERQIRRLQFGF